MGRPRREVPVIKLLELRLGGASWPEISRALGISYGTVYRAYAAALKALQAPVWAKVPKKRGADAWMS